MHSRQMLHVMLRARVGVVVPVDMGVALPVVPVAKASRRTGIALSARGERAIAFIHCRVQDSASRDIDIHALDLVAA